MLPERCYALQGNIKEIIHAEQVTQLVIIEIRDYATGKIPCLAGEH
jgi:hypothetical protein